MGRHVLAATVVAATLGLAVAFTETNKLLASLDAVQTQTTLSGACVNQMEPPRMRMEKFVKDTVGMYNGLQEVNARVGTINTVASTLLLVPGVNKLGAIVLIPLTTSLTWLSRTISITSTACEPIIKALSDWEKPIKSAGEIAQSSKTTFHNLLALATTGKQHIGQVGSEISMVSCGTTRSNLVTTMETTARGMDATPNMVIEEMKRADGACQEIKTFLTYSEDEITREAQTAVSFAQDGIDALNSGIDPIQGYLDEVNKVLDHELCASEVARLLEDVIEPARKPVKEVVEKTVDTAKEVAKEAKKFFGRWGRRRRAVQTEEESRRKRDVCVTVRQVLDGSVAVDGGYTSVAEYLVKEVFNKVMPKLPGVNNDLKKLASKLLPFSSDYNLAAKVEAMKLSTTAVNPFLATNYVTVFSARPAAADMVGTTSCSGETALVIPTQ